MYSVISSLVGRQVFGVIWIWWLKYCMIAFDSGVAGLLVSHPLDTVKVRLQSLQTYKGAVNCIVRTMQEESIRGFYKGMSIPLLTAGFLHSTFFLGNTATLAVIEKLKRDSRPHQQQRRENPLHILLLASVTGAMLQWIPSCPIEIVKTKLQVQQENVHHLLRSQPPALPNQPNQLRVLFTGPIDCIRQTVRHVGIKGFYKGGLTMLVRDCIGFCFYLPVYEMTLRRLISSTNDRRYRSWFPFVAGGLAGVACWWSILPLDVIKSRLQADDLLRPKYQGFWHCVVDTYEREGLKAFVRGWHVSALRGLPACACLFFVYEETLRILDYGRKMITE